MLDLTVEDGGHPQLLVRGRPWITAIGLRLPPGSDWIPEASGELSAGRWSRTVKQGETKLTRTFCAEESPVLSMEILCTPRSASVVCRLLADLPTQPRTDAFDNPFLLAPSFSVNPDLRFFLTTFGQGRADEPYPGGHWPSALEGRAPADLPPEGFAPLVLHSPSAALAIAPADLQLTSPMVRVPGGTARAVPSSPTGLAAGQSWETWIYAGSDLYGALRSLGDGLLSRSGKSREATQSHLVNTRLGWWNAYGGYYTELFRPLDATALEQVERSLQALGLPVGYLGIDLWYPYSRIGQATRFSPDPTKYPQGLNHRRRALDVPYVLHLSALAPDNDYGTAGADPAYYREVSQELRLQGAEVVWHDWLRTQQHVTPELRTNPESAERWFAGMAGHMREQELAVILCMHTMGMALASTSHQNIVAARSYTDFLFCQREALQRAAEQGHADLLESWISPSELRTQNALVGMVLDSLGLAPFYDLFLSKTQGGLGGVCPVEEALLRALSCGPVGIGDGPGHSDGELLGRTLLDDGVLAHPDTPLVPETKSLGKDVLLLWTRRSTPAGDWWYAVAVNRSNEPLRVSIDPPGEDQTVCWDLLAGHMVSCTRPTIPPNGLGGFLFAPVRDGVAPLGFTDKLVPTPRTAWSARWEGGWHLPLSSGGQGALWAPCGARVEHADGSRPPQKRQGELVFFQASREDGELRVRGRRRSSLAPGGGGAV